MSQYNVSKESKTEQNVHRRYQEVNELFQNTIKKLINCFKVLLTC